MDDQPGSALLENPHGMKCGLKRRAAYKWQCSSFIQDHCADYKIIVVQNYCIFLPSSAMCMRAGSRTKHSLKWWTSPVFKMWVKTEWQWHSARLIFEPGSLDSALVPTVGQVLIPPGCEWNEVRSYLLLPVWLSGGGHPWVCEVNRWFSVTSKSSGSQKLWHLVFRVLKVSFLWMYSRLV